MNSAGGEVIRWIVLAPPLEPRSPLRAALAVWHRRSRSEDPLFVPWALQSGTCISLRGSAITAMVHNVLVVFSVVTIDPYSSIVELDAFLNRIVNRDRLFRSG